MMISIKRSGLALLIALFSLGLLFLFTATAQGETLNPDTVVRQSEFLNRPVLTSFWTEDFSTQISATTYYTFANSGSGIVDNGSFLLTPDTGSRRSRIFYLTPTVMSNFTATFDLYLGDDPGGADGAAFIFCPSYDYTPVGGGFLDASCPDGYLVGIKTWGGSNIFISKDDVTGNNRFASAGITNLEDDTWHNVTVIFNQPLMTVTLDGSTIFDGVTLTDYEPFYGYFGFSGATGGASNEQRLDNIQINNVTQVAILPQVSEGYPSVGNSIIYTKTLYNQTGATDSFTLTLTGNNWPTTLSVSNTGVLSYGAGLSFTVQVDVPGGNTLGDVDTASIMAQSALNPGVFSATATLSTTVSCSPSITINGQSASTYKDLDDIYEYGGQLFEYINVNIFSSDDNSMNAILWGYDPNSGWEVIASLANAGNQALYDDYSLPPRYSQVRVQLDDTQNNDTIYYTYQYKLCREAAVDIKPDEAQNGYAPLGSTAILTYTLTNFSQADSQFDLSVVGNNWATTFHTTAGLAITQTPLLTDLEVYTFTTHIAVPNNALPGDSDSSQLIAFQTGNSNISDTVVMTTSALCSNTTVISGQSASTLGDLDDYYDYGGQIFQFAKVDIFSSDNNTLVATLSGYDPLSGWEDIASLSNSRNDTLFEGYLLPPRYTQMRVQLDDTQDNDTIYYTYQYEICRSDTVDIDPDQPQTVTAYPGGTGVLTYTLTNFAQEDSAFNLSLSGNVWTTTLYNTGGAGITQTPVLSDLAVYTFTAQVNVPADALFGETDTTNLSASAVNTPALSDSVTFSTTAICSNTLVLSGQSAQVHGDILDDSYNYGGQLFMAAKIDIDSSDNDTMNATLSGYNPSSGWEIIKSGTGLSNGTFFDDFVISMGFTEIRMELLDTENNDDIYYDYEFQLCRESHVDIKPDEPQTISAFAGDTAVLTYTLLNYTQALTQFNLNISGNNWPVTLHTTAGLIITQTPILSDLEAYTFTAHIDVPALAQPGETDETDLMAVATGNPLISDTVVLTASVACSNTLIFSGQSPTGYAEILDITHDYQDQLFQRATIDIYSSDNDSMDATLSGYDPAVGWQVIAMITDADDMTFFDGELTPIRFTQLRMQLTDTEDNDTFYYDYSFEVCRKANIAIQPSEPQFAFGPIGGTAVLTYTVTNYTFNNDQFDLSLSTNLWPGELRDSNGVAISQTPILSDLEAYTFTTHIDVPASVTVGDTDSALLLAQSINNNVFSDTATFTTSAICSSTLTFSGQSDQVYGQSLDQIYEYGDQVFQYATIDLFSSDDDTMDATLSGYDPSSGWEVIAEVTNVGNIVFVDQYFFPPRFTQLRMQLTDTDNNDTIYYNYSFGLCRSATVYLEPVMPQNGTGLSGETAVLTYTLTNYTLQDTQINLSVSANVWTTTLRDTGGVVISQTPVLSDKQAYTFSAHIDIPPDSLPGDYDAGLITVADASASNVQDSGAFTVTTLSGQFGYVMNRQVDQINVVDTILNIDTGLPIDTTLYGEGPLRGAISPNGQWLYAGLQFSNTVLIVSTTNHLPVTSLPVGGQPQGIAFSNDSAYAFIANQNNNAIRVIDTAALTVAQTITVGNRPLNLAGSACFNKLYATVRDDDSVAIIDSNALTVTQVITGFARPYDVVVSPAGQRAYVTNQNDGSIGVIDTATDQLIATWPIPNANWLASLDITPDGSALYVVDTDEQVIYVLNTADGKVITTIPIAVGNKLPWDVEVFPASAGPYAYVSISFEADFLNKAAVEELALNPYEADVVVLNTETYSIVDDFKLTQSSFPEPRGLALFPQETYCGQGVAFSPVNAEGFGDAGSTLAFSQTIINNTGVDDSFDINLSGNIWPTTLTQLGGSSVITNSGTIANGASFSFTVWVDIPVTALIGDYDSVTLNAVSTNAPAVYSATAQLTSRVMRPGYVFNPDSDEIQIVDTFSHQNTGIAIDTSPYGAFPWRGALSPNGQWLYASLRDDDQVLVISTTTQTPVATVTVGSTPHGIAFSPNGANAFVANRDSDTVSVIDTTALTVTTVISVENSPFSIATSACLNKFYVTNKYSNTLSVIDLNTLSATNVITGFDEPWDVIISPFGDRAYISNQNTGTISVLDTLTDSIVATWDVNGSWIQGLDLSLDGSLLYVVDNDEPYTYIVDTATGQIVKTITTGDGWDVEVFPFGAGDYAYVSVVDNNSLSVIDTTSLDLVQGVYMGDGRPRGLALFPPSAECAQLPTAAFTPTTSSIEPGDTISFTNLSTGSSPLVYSWNFGDGSAISNVTNPSHTYATTGTFAVILTATNAVGNDVATGTVVVSGTTLTPPIAAFSPVNSFIQPGGTVTFTNLSTGSLPLSYAWDFGDGSGISNGINPSHTYVNTGTYSVALTTTNLAGSDVATGMVTVTEDVLTFTLSVNIVGSGQVNLNPPGTQGSGITDFSSIFTAGLQVQMTTVPTTGWQFDSWSGDASGSTPVIILIDRNKLVTATFSQTEISIYLPLVLKN